MKKIFCTIGLLCALGAPMPLYADDNLDPLPFDSNEFTPDKAKPSAHTAEPVAPAQCIPVKKTRHTKAHRCPRIKSHTTGTASHPTSSKNRKIKGKVASKGSKHTAVRRKKSH